MKINLDEKDQSFWEKKSLKEQLYLAWQVLFGLPKSLIFNFHYFGIKGIKLPVICSYKVKLSKMKGIVLLNSTYHTGMIKLGFTAPENYDNRRLSFIWVNEGAITFNGRAGIRNGVSIRNYGYLTFGNEFHISAPSSIICYKSITFGEDVLISWNCEFTDGDAHKIYDLSDVEMHRTNVDKAIRIGNHVWIASNVKVLKGTEVGDNNIIAAGSILNKCIPGNNQIIGGVPATIIRRGVNWHV